MTQSRFIPLTPDLRVPLVLGADRHIEHLFEPPHVHAINTAIACSRPLLLTGEPGVGKTQLARAAARALGRVFVRCTVDGKTEARDLLWQFDAVARLAEGSFQPEGLAEPVRAGPVPPFVVITSNRERGLPDAFVRRCVVLHMQLPAQDGPLRELLVKRGRAHSSLPEEVLEQAADLLIEDRKASKKPPPPGAGRISGPAARRGRTAR